MIVEGCGYILTGEECAKAAAYAKAHTPPNETVTAVYISQCYDEYASDCVYISWHVRKPPELVRLKEIKT